MRLGHRTIHPKENQFSRFFIFLKLSIPLPGSEIRMTSTSMQTEMISRLKVGVLASHSQFTQAGRTSQPARAVRPPARSTSLYVVPRQLPLEKGLMALLAAAAVGSIAYGFSCMLDLVQHWASFQQGISKLVE
jgi:hypothetical protein